MAIFNQSNLVAKILAKAKSQVGAHKTTHAVGGADAIFPADPAADRYLKFNNTSNALEWAEVTATLAEADRTKLNTAIIFTYTL